MINVLCLFQQKSGEKDSHFHDQNLLIMVSNLFAAGNNTTDTTLMLMAKYPNTCQEDVQTALFRPMDFTVQVTYFSKAFQN